MCPLQGRLLPFLDLLQQQPRLASKLLLLQLMDSSRQSEDCIHAKFEGHLTGTALPGQQAQQAQVEQALAWLRREWQQPCPARSPYVQQGRYFIHLFIITSAQLRSQCDVWLALKASLQTEQHALHAASESGCYFNLVCKQQPSTPSHHSLRQTEPYAWSC
jgi:hypothetical protein